MGLLHGFDLAHDLGDSDCATCHGNSCKSIQKSVCAPQKNRQMDAPIVAVRLSNGRAGLLNAICVVASQNSLASLKTSTL